MEKRNYQKGFLPYAAAALLVGLVGGFSAVLGPAFVRDLGLAYNNTTWTALATAVTTAAFAPIMGKLADAVGRRRMLLLGLAVYTLGNALTAMAPSLMVMLLARLVVGTGTAAIAPVVIAYILTEFPPEKIAKGFSLYMLISSGAVVIGPTAGSWIISNWGWRAMIWLCTALCGLALLYCIFVQEENKTRENALAGFDAAGAVLVVVFFSLALCVPSFGQNLGWDSAVFRIIFVAAVLALLALVTAEKRALSPILPLDILKQKRFLLSVLALFLTQGLMQANMTNTIVFVEYTQPGNTVVSGFAVSVMYIGMALGAVALGPLADKYEPKLVLTGSLALTAAGCGIMLFFSQSAPAGLLMLSLGILGFGLGANGTIFMKVVLSGIPRKMAGAGTGTYGLFRDLAAPFGVAVLVPMFTNGITDGIEEGMEAAAAAVSAIRTLAIVEVICVLAGILVVRFLPDIRSGKTEI
ncbi:MAG: MFS transporter [Oscillospiraceae bacterium]|nr:MFS transporter [Oscillospiraceae bacterium]